MGEVVGVAVFTLLMAAGSTVAIAGPGVALAWALSVGRWPGKGLVETVVALPLVLPPVATGLVLLWLLRRRGAMGQWLESVGIEVVFSAWGVGVAMAVMSFPLLVRTSRAAFESVNPRMGEVARTLGAGEWRIFWRITAPLAWRGLVAAFLLAFARALGEFGATVVLAGNIPGRTTTLALATYQELLLARDEMAAVYAACSIALAFGAVAGSEWLVRRGDRTWS